MDHVPPDDEIKASWDANADRWAATYDEDGDRNRRYQSDQPMLAMLGDVNGRTVLDAGSGQGYLSRKLAKMGAHVTGVELADRFFRMAVESEQRDAQGVRYLQGTLASMPSLNDGEFDKAVSNYVLMDVRDYAQAAREVARVVKPGGLWIVVISHPCFSCGPEIWEMSGPIDSPRNEDRLGWVVDRYFHSGPIQAQWRDLDPVISFHRPLRDYWQTFTQSGWTIDAFEEPSISDRGRSELAPRQIAECLRRPYSCIFRLVKN
jgi:ubiquinone/menaquinone biosynthesis C-methylase UbiE